MKKLILVLALGFYSNAFADVCQIKPNQNKGAGLINIYALMQGQTQIGAATLYEVDLQSLVKVRDSLIEKGVCESEPVLENCSISLDTNLNAPVVVNIGNTKLNNYGANWIVDSYSLDVAAKTIKMLQSARVCK